MDTEELKRMRQAGAAYTTGALVAISNIVVIVAILALIGNAIRNRFDINTDDTDYDGRNRSGLSLHTDAKTGVQYLSDGKGGMHVRIGTNGLPITK